MKPDKIQGERNRLHLLLGRGEKITLQKAFRMGRIAVAIFGSNLPQHCNVLRRGVVCRTEEVNLGEKSGWAELKHCSKPG